MPKGHFKRSAQFLKHLKEHPPMLGKHHSLESREKMSLAKKGKQLSMFHREQLKKHWATHPHPMLGKKHSLKSILKMRKSAINKHNGPKNPAWKGGRYKSSHGYVYVWQPTHPFHNNDGYLFEHRLIMEKHLNRYLQKGEVVHHINGKRDDNRIENLVLLTNQAHTSLHSKINHKLGKFPHSPFSKKHKNKIKKALKRFYKIHKSPYEHHLK